MVIAFLILMPLALAQNTIENPASKPLTVPLAKGSGSISVSSFEISAREAHVEWTGTVRLSLPARIVIDLSSTLDCDSGPKKWHGPIAIYLRSMSADVFPNAAGRVGRMQVEN